MRTSKFYLAIGLLAPIALSLVHAIVSAPRGDSSQLAVFAAAATGSGGAIFARWLFDCRAAGDGLVSYAAAFVAVAWLAAFAGSLASWDSEAPPPLEARAALVAAIVWSSAWGVIAGRAARSSSVAIS